MRRVAVFLWVFASLLLLLSLPTAAETAVRLDAALTAGDGTNLAALTDRNKSSYVTLPAGQTVSVSLVQPAAGLYLTFDRVPGEWTLTADGHMIACGGNGFLHEYVDLTAIGGAQEMLLSFPGGVALAELSLWSAGELPGEVQRWEPPLARADLLLFSTHSDDEHLFFAGIIPTCLDRGQSVQVVYMTNHLDTHNRPHEQLDGLWAVGVRHYPIVGPFPDLYSTALETARTIYAGRGYSTDDFIAYAVEQLRRFRPQVVVGHDVAGEYSHGAHMINTEALMAALTCSADPAAYPESASVWGTWDVPKTYLHLWGERQVVMDWDVPLAAYGGMTAFEVSRLGYDEHVSQHWTWFTRWVRGTAAAPITAAAQITTYSPCRYGLYRTTVGDDPAGVNDFFANLIPYAGQTTAPPETTAAPPDTTRTPQSAVQSEPVADTGTDTAYGAAQTQPPGGTEPLISPGVIAAAALIIVLVVVLSAILGPVSGKRGK